MQLRKLWRWRQVAFLLKVFLLPLGKEVGARPATTNVLFMLVVVARFCNAMANVPLVVSESVVLPRHSGVHRVKNPLGGVRGAAQLLAKELPNAELTEYTDVIIREADRLRDLVDRLLGPNRQLDTQPLNIHEIMEHVRNLITAESGNQVTIKRDYDPSLPEFPCDRAQLIQAVLNIMRNALQAAAPNLDQCEIVLRTRSQRQFTVGAKLHRLVCRVDIIDNGPGIPAELMPAVFAPMVTGRADGTGLGLSIAKNAALNHGGELNVIAAPGKPDLPFTYPWIHAMYDRAEVWIADDDSSIRWVLERALNKAGIANRCFEDADTLLQQIASEQPDVVISDIRMPGTGGLTLLSMLGERYPDLPVIITTAHSDLESAVASYQKGAFEYLPKPFDMDEVVAVTERALAQAAEQRGNTPAPEELPFTEIIGEAPAMQEVFRAIGRLAHSNITVLINGESGTGKELVARALHRHSPRSDAPFIALNMAAIPKDLIDSELFGHEKGAFTGASASARVGLNRPMAAPYSSMKSGICLPTLRLGCCESLLTESFIG